MKKKIQSENLLGKFEASKLTALSTITGGVAVAKTTTIGYETKSSADDADTGDHDDDNC